MSRVSLVAVFRDGKLLLGKRRDNGKWTMPGGHLDEGEDPTKGALRELLEETGLKPDKMWRLDERQLGRTTIFTYRADCAEGSPTSENDPDEECLFWRWVDVSDGVPADIAENAHGPEDSDKNVLLDVFGMKKSERVHGEELEKGGGYDEHGWPLRAPRGFVDPQGKFYSVGDEDHHDWVMNHVGADPDSADNEYSKLLKQGWMAVGVAGGHNVQAHRQHLENPEHPATKVVRQLAQKHFGPKFEAMVHGDSGYEGEQDLDTTAFAGTGRLAPPSPFRKDEEELEKHDTPEFQNWFQGSKVVDENGAPRRVFHGTSKDRDFSTFKVGERGAWFTTDPKQASNYANENDSVTSRFDPASGRYASVNQAARVIPAYLSLKNPYKMTEADNNAHQVAPNYQRHQAAHFRKLKTAGHDGVDFGDGTYVAFHPHQIKGIFNERPTSARALNKDEADLEKMAIASIPKGDLVAPPADQVYGYDHVLTPEHRAAGYSVKVEENPGSIRARLFHQGAKAGYVVGFHDPDPKKLRRSIEPHSEVAEAHRGKGLGTALYEALYAHAFHSGIRKVSGGGHSDDAHAVHQRLAAKHGLLYDPMKAPRPEWHGNYSYAIKAEEEVGEELQKMQRLGGFPGLGIEDRRETPLVNTVSEKKLKQRQVEANFNRVHRYVLGAEPDSYTQLRHNYAAADIMLRNNGIVMGPKRPMPKANVSYAYGNAMRRGPTSQTSDLATKAHEDFHQMMQRVGERFGYVCRQTLAHNLWHSVPQKAYAQEFVNWKNGHLIDSKDQYANEEHLAALHNYMNDSVMRGHFFKYKDYTPEQARVVDSGIKDSFRKLQQSAAKADHTWTAKEIFQPLQPQTGLTPPPVSARPTPQATPVPRKTSAPTKPSSPNQLNLFKCSLAAEGLIKSEDDEVDRMLLHPNVAERRMALKLGTVKEKHLVRALRDEDPEIQRQALRHPALGPAALLSLMQMPDRKHLQLLSLQHPRIDRDHVEALYHTHKDQPVPERAEVMRAISHHPDLDAHLIEKMVEDGHGHDVVENLNTPVHVLERLIEAHSADPTDPGKRALARRALQHPAAPSHLVEKAFKEGPADVKLAVARGPHLPGAVAQDHLARGLLPGHDDEALLRTAIVQHPDATDAHLKTATRDVHQLVRAHAQKRLGVFKHGREVGAWLAKAVEPMAFAGLRAQSDDEARSAVDYAPDLDAHPPQHEPDVQAYRNHILNSEGLHKPLENPQIPAGVSAKVVFKLPEHHPTHPNARFMTKVYHEPIFDYRNGKRLYQWGEHPHVGWTEMTNQALYHAADVGHLHQKVHVAEHNMGPDREKEPALVIKMEPGHTLHRHVDVGAIPQHGQHAARQIALMDFLTDNPDRHYDNLMWKDGVPLAIDHGRAMQYHTNNFTTSQRPTTNFRLYHSQATRDVTGSLGDQRENASWAPVFDWWHQVGPQVRTKFHQRLQQIKDPKARLHMQGNFDERAAALDRWAGLGHMDLVQNQPWYREPVRLYHPDELASREQA